MERLAEIEIDAVTPSPHGFILTGQGTDRADYRLDLDFDLPLDPRTRAVLGELLAQSEIAISRSTPSTTGQRALRRPLRSARAPRPNS